MQLTSMMLKRKTSDLFCRELELCWQLVNIPEDRDPCVREASPAGQLYDLLKQIDQSSKSTAETHLELQSLCVRADPSKAPYDNHRHDNAKWRGPPMTRKLKHEMK